jgi:hypothetical protein
VEGHLSGRPGDEGDTQVGGALIEEVLLRRASGDENFGLLMSILERELAYHS